MSAKEKTGPVLVPQPEDDASHTACRKLRAAWTAMMTAHNAIEHRADIDDVDTKAALDVLSSACCMVEDAVGDLEGKDANMFEQPRNAAKENA